MQMISETHRVSFVKVRALTGKEWDCEDWDRDIWIGSDDDRILKYSCLKSL